MADPPARTDLLVISAGTVVLTFSRVHGGLVALAIADGTRFSASDTVSPALDVCLGDRGWLCERTFSRYLGHHVHSNDGGTTVAIMIGLGPLRITDRYTVTGTLIARSIEVENVSDDDHRLLGVRLSIVGLSVGGRISGIFDAPGNSVRPRVPLAIAAAQRRDVLPRRFFAPGLRAGRAFEPYPVVGEGLLALHSEDDRVALLCWYESPDDLALPQLAGDDLTLIFEHEVAAIGWLLSGARVTVGSQYLLLLHELWHTALSGYVHTRRLLSRTAPLSAPGWLHDAALYEVHPAQVGGFAALAEVLPELAALGITCVCLPSIWERTMPAGTGSDDTWLDGQLHELHGLYTLAAADAAALHDLVATAHASGLRVLLDLPLIGAAADAALVADRPTWFCHDIDGRPALRGDDAAIVPFDLTSPELQLAIVAQARHWLASLGHDGYRLVPARETSANWSVRAVARTPGLAGGLHIAEQLHTMLYTVQPDAALVADVGGAHVAQHYHAVVDELAHHQFVHAALGRLSPAELGTWLDDARRIASDQMLRICFTESRRTRTANPIAAGLRGSRISRMLLAGQVFCGYVPLLWHGQERGESGLIARLLAARAASPALRRGNVAYDMVECASDQVFAVVRQYEGETLIGIMHMGAHQRHTSLRLATAMLAEDNLCAHDLLGEPPWASSQHHAIVAGALHVELEPFAAYLLQIRRCEAEEGTQ